MRERDRIERKKWMEEQAAIEAAEQAERERPLREAEKQLQRNAAELGKFMRETILSGPDPEFQIPASASALAMSEKEAAEFIGRESDKFLSDNPAYYPCRENFNSIIDFLLRNKIQIPTAECFKNAWLRLKTFGLIEERPAAPEPEIIEEPKPDPAATRAEQRRAYYEDVIAYDPRDPQRTFTAYQLDELPGEEYRRIVFGPHYTPNLRDVFSKPIGAAE